MQSYVLLNVLMTVSSLVFVSVMLACWKCPRHLNTALFFIAPFLATLVMGYIFALHEGKTVAQFAIEGDKRTMWSLWVKWFLPLLSLTGLSVLCSLIGVCFSLYRKRGWSTQAGMIGLAGLFSVLAFFAVAVNFPTA